MAMFDCACHSTKLSFSVARLSIFHAFPSTHPLFKILLNVIYGDRKKGMDHIADIFFWSCIRIIHIQLNGKQNEPQRRNATQKSTVRVK